VDGLNKASKPSTNLPEKSSLVTRKMGRILTRHSRNTSRKNGQHKKTGNRKRNCIETCNDLNEEEMKRNYEENNVEEVEGWVA
jgi:hypothetical protein